MSAISEISSWLTTQNVFGNSSKVQPKNDSKTQGSDEPQSFFSMLKLFDANADGKISSDELKFGAGFMINSLFYPKDANGDQQLTTGESGVSQNLITSFDTNGDQMLGAKEIITPVNNIIDGIVSILDTDGDQALSREELGIVDLLFNLASNIYSDQTSESVNPDQAFDLNTIPDRMRQAGFQGTDNQLYYVLASTYAGMPWQPDPTDPVSVTLSDQRDKIYDWFDKIVNNVSRKMEASPNVKATAIINDGPDRCGSRLGAAIMDKLNKFGDRVQIGTSYEGSA